jgi:hypothetical protein
MSGRTAAPGGWRRGPLVLALLLGCAVAGTARGAVTPVQVSADPFTNPTSQHATEVEPDDLAVGSTIVATFQVGRFVAGGASGIGWARSGDAGATWTHGVLPGLTAFAGGPADAASDPSVAYDARHGVWLITALPVGGPASVPGVSVSRSSDGGLTWGAPVGVVGHTDADKPWTACDDTLSSPYYGRCYTMWQAGNAGPFRISTSRDGGLTWSAPVGTAGGASGDATQPLVQPSGRVVVTADNPDKSAIVAFASDDGGASWSAPVTVAPVSVHREAGFRSFPEPSAAMAADGTIWAAWQDCRFRAGCAANDIVLASSADGLTWSPVTRVPIDPATSGVDHFIPGLGVDPATSGPTTRLALAYHATSASGCAPSCELGVGALTSGDAGATWSAPIALAGPMRSEWLADTSAGRMVGDYISTAFTADGVAHPIFAAAGPPRGATFDESMWSASVPVGVAASPPAPAPLAAPVPGPGPGPRTAPRRTVRRRLLVRAPRRVRAGRAFGVRVTLSAGLSPRGSLEIQRRARARFVGVLLHRGAARRVTLRLRLAPGRHVLRVTYRRGRTAVASRPFVVIVLRR